jgi:hypothetical protein
MVPDSRDITTTSPSAHFDVFNADTDEGEAESEESQHISWYGFQSVEVIQKWCFAWFWTTGGSQGCLVSMKVRELFLGGGCLAACADELWG